MAERRTTDAQDAILAEIAKAVAAEKAAEHVATIEAQELIRTRTKEARVATNALVYVAEHEYRVTKSAIAKRGFGNTNRQAIDARLKEHEYRNSGPAMPTTPSAPAQTAPTPPADQAVRVENEEYGWAVSFDQFTHEDVGTNMSGEVHFDQVGQFISADGAIGVEVSANPLMAMRVWGLEEVQRVIRSA